MLLPPTWARRTTCSVEETVSRSMLRSTESMRLAGLATHVADLPAASSDQAGATLAGTAYVVGGFTGSRWLDTIVAFHPPRFVRVVAHLPVALRYAAVTAVGGDVIIAGGSLPTDLRAARSTATGPAMAFARSVGSRWQRRTLQRSRPTGTHWSSGGRGALATGCVRRSWRSIRATAVRGSSANCHSRCRTRPPSPADGSLPSADAARPARPTQSFA